MVQRRLLLVRGVWPLLGKRAANTDEMLDGALETAVRTGLVQEGDTVIITAGISPNMPGSTDLMKVETVPEVLGRGTGVLDFVLNGRVRHLNLTGEWTNLIDHPLRLSTHLEYHFAASFQRRQNLHERDRTRRTCQHPLRLTFRLCRIIKAEGT